MSRATVKRLALVAVIALCIAAFFGLGLEHSLSLASLKASRARFAELYAGHAWAVLAAYFVAYVLVAALSLPGAAAMTLVGGALFGFWITLLLVSFASTIGATAACALSRYLFRDAVLSRFGDKLAAIDAGMAREGAFYLFTLRLIPLFPFFVVNLVMGLTSLPLRTYYLVSQIGMLPGTMVYVNAGKELGKIDSLAGILSPGLIVSFAILGLFPLAAKRLVAVWRKRSGKTSSPSP